MKKKTYRTRRALAAGALWLIALGLGWLFRHHIGCAARAAYNRLRYGVTTVRAPADADRDGLDDAADIMLGARRYVMADPVYDSEYYDGGYPPEGRGV